MTDQTRWGIHEIQTKNKAIKYRRDLVAKAMETVVKLDETGITDLMLQIEAEYERKYGNNKADKVVLQTMYMYGKKNKKKIKTTLKII